jgi:hypothetical protein
MATSINLTRLLVADADRILGETLSHPGPVNRSARIVPDGHPVASFLTPTIVVMPTAAWVPR